MKKLLLQSVIFMCIYTFPYIDQTFALDYYIDVTHGSNTNSGLTPTEAWETISKINLSTFNPGDRILFKSGQKWREQLNVPSSGAPSNPIIIGSYEIGNKPIISGAEVIADFIQHSTSIWKKIISYPQQVFYNEIRGVQQIFLSRVDADKEWFYDSVTTTLYIYSDGNPSLIYTSPGIEASLRQNCIYLMEDYITIENLQLEKSSNSAVKITPFSQNITIDNVTLLQWSNELNWEFDYTDEIDAIGGIDIYGSSCEIKNSTFGRNTGNDIADQNWAGFVGIHVDASDNIIHHNNFYHNSTENEDKLGHKAFAIRLSKNTQGITEVYSNYIYHTGSQSIFVKAITKSGDIIRIYDNTIEYPGMAGISCYKTRKEDGIGGIGYIYRNHVSFANRLGSEIGGGGNQASAIHMNDGVKSGLDTARPFMKWYIFENIVHNSQTPKAPNVQDASGISMDFNANDVEVFRNLVYNNWGKGIYMWNASRCKIYYNIIYGNDVGTTVSAAIGTEEVADHNQILNNTYYKNYNTDAYGPNLDAEIHFGGKGNFTIIKNNIFYGHPNGVIYYFRNANSIGCLTDYNIVYKDSGNFAWNHTTGYLPTFDDWKADHPEMDIHSINADPQFMNSGDANFQLLPTSPAINNGDNIGFSFDYYNNPLNEIPDIGAVEFHSQVEVDTLILLSASINNANTLHLFFSKEVDKSTAENSDNYSISDGIKIIEITLADNNKEVIITTTDHVLEQLYTITVSNVFDIWGIPISSSNNTYQYSYLDETIPVELMSFSSVIMNNKVELTWATATETNNAGFEIQKIIYDKELSNESVWVKIGFVPGKNNSTLTHYYKFIDEIPGKGAIDYRLKQINLDGTFEFSEVIKLFIEQPITFQLKQNYPNPFNPSTKINFSLAEKNKVLLRIYNALGKHIADVINEERDAGDHSVIFYADELSSGIYFYTLQAGKFNEAKKMVVIK